MKRSTPLRRTPFKTKALVRKAMSSTPKGAKSKAKRLADYWFSRYIRWRDADEHGYVICITSGRRLHWKEVDCGHWISRAKMSTRYVEENANAQSKMANRFQGGMFLEHGLAIDRKFGPGTRERLERLAVQSSKKTTADLLWIAEDFKRRALAIEKP